MSASLCDRCVIYHAHRKDQNTQERVCRRVRVDIRQIIVRSLTGPLQVKFDYSSSNWRSKLFSLTVF